MKAEKQQPILIKLCTMDHFKAQNNTTFNSLASFIEPCIKWSDNVPYQQMFSGGS